MSSQGRREESLIQSLDEQYGSSAPAEYVLWICSTCHKTHKVRAGEPLRCLLPPRVLDGRHLLTC